MKVKTQSTSLNPGGATAIPKDNNRGRLRQAKLSSVALNFGSTARVKIMRMVCIYPTTAEKGPTYRTDCLQQCDLLDPLQTQGIAKQVIVHEFKVHKIIASRRMLILELAKDTDDAIKLIKDIYIYIYIYNLIESAPGTTESNENLHIS